jgi:phosphate transport system permease protein
MIRMQKDKLSVGLLWVAALLVLGSLFLVVGYILIHGLSVLFWESEAMGIWSALFGTVYLVLLSLIFAVPVGVGSAIYFSEYVKHKTTTRCLHSITELLASVPSILIGLFGFSFFVDFLGLGWSLLSGSLTLSLMILPTIQRTAQEAISSVPTGLKEGSLALGATRWQTVVQVILPSVLPGIIKGIILAVSRSVGETTAVLLTAGNFLTVSRSPARSLSVHLFIQATEGSLEGAYATAALLVVLVFLINTVANQIRRKL